MFALTLECSTAYAPSPDPHWGGLSVHGLHDVGWLLWVPPDGDPVWTIGTEDGLHGVPKWIVPLLTWCAEHGVRFILFDKDGPRPDIPGVRAYEW